MDGGVSSVEKQNYVYDIHLKYILFVSVLPNSISYIYIYTHRKTRLSETPGHRTVQEGLSIVSCRESITKSKHVLYWKLFTPIFRP